jgi:hypothetical protein
MSRKAASQKPASQNATGKRRKLSSRLAAGASDSALLRCAQQDYETRLRAKVAAVPLEQRREIGRLLRHEGKTVGEICALLELETMVVSQIIVDNTEERGSLVLKETFS